MKCKDVKNILLEFESIELSEVYNKELIAHISDCPQCKLFLQEIENADSVIEKLKTNPPQLDDPDLITNKILYSIRKEQLQKAGVSESFIEKTSNWFLLKQVRLALYSIIVLFTILYFYEETVALKSVLTLEENLNIAGQSYEASLSDNLPNLSFIYDLYKLVKGEKKYLNLSNDWMMVNKDALRKILNEYSSIADERMGEIEMLRKSLSKEQNEFLDEILSIKKNEKQILGDVK